MLKSMEDLIRALALIPPGSHVLCAVSGGADSVCLLHALYQLRDKLQFTLSAAHFDHRLRGEESQRDAAFVAQFVSLCCGPHRLPDGRVLPAIPLYSGAGDVAETARRRGIGLEQAGREMRYDFLRQVARDIGAGRIATAHNADDNAETILFHLARGSGLRGLGGIPPVRGELIRPLLTTTRREILDYLAHHSCPTWRTAPTTATTTPETASATRSSRCWRSSTPASGPDGGHRLPPPGGRVLSQPPGGTHRRAGRSGGGATLHPRRPSGPGPGPGGHPRPAPPAGAGVGGDQDCGSAHLWAMLQLCRGEAPSAQVHLPHGYTARREYQLLRLVPRLGPIPLEAGPVPLPGREIRGPWTVTCAAGPYGGQPRARGTSGWTGPPSPPCRSGPAGPETG